MDKQCEEHQKKIEEINNNVKEIRKILVGNGEIGICETVRNHDTFIQKFKKRRYDISNILYRSIVAIALAFIMVKLGLK